MKRGRAVRRSERSIKRSERVAGRRGRAVTRPLARPSHMGDA